jgi:hypothetical protein
MRWCEPCVTQDHIKCAQGGCHAVCVVLALGRRFACGPHRVKHRLLPNVMTRACYAALYRLDLRAVCDPDAEAIPPRQAGVAVERLGGRGGLPVWQWSGDTLHSECFRTTV